MKKLLEPAPLNLVIKLDDIRVGEWDETIAEILRDEMKSAIRQAVRDSLKDNKKLKDLIKQYADEAIGIQRGTT